MKSAGIPLLGLPILLLALGCGGGTDQLQVKGVLLKDGSPFPFTPETNVQIQFRMEEKSYATSATVDNKTGEFQVRGADGKGIPIGTYRIFLQAVEGSIGPDLFKGVFAEGKSPLKYTFSSSEDLVIDVGKKTVSKR